MSKMHVSRLGGAFRPLALRLLALSFLAFGILAPAMVWSAAEAASGKRVALVIGNASYQNYPALKNPVKDVDAVAQTLRTAGFDVLVGHDVGRLGLEDLLKQFYRNLQNADASLIYYSGHAIQVADENYLIPVDARLEGKYDLEFQTVSLAGIFAYMREHSRTQLLFLDACRDNPFQGREFIIGESTRSRAQSQGLARIDAQVGSLISYSTEPGNVAYDGEGPLSPFTSSFVERALSPNLEVRQLLTLVRREVVEKTQGLQVPWETSSLLEDFYFVARSGAPKVEPLHRVAAFSGAETTALDIPVPVSEYGGTLTVVIEGLPEKGRLELGGRVLQPGDKLPVARLGELRFALADASRDDVLLASYRVENEWGGQARALVAIQVTDDPKVAQAEEARKSDRIRLAHASLKEFWSSNKEIQVATPLGVGPISLPFRSVRAVEDADLPISIRVAEAPRIGVLRLDDRVVNEGATLSLSDVDRLRVEAPIGSEGARETISLSVEAPGADPMVMRVNLEATVLECDLLAGAPLDRQSVGAGVLPNEIDAARAIAACRRDIQRYGELPRLLYQLGRAHLANRDVPEAARVIDKAAAAGHVRAVYQQGLMALNGVRGPIDRKRAAQLFERAAAKGDVFAMHNRGKMLVHGDGIPADRPQGLALLMSAAEAGHTYAFNELGNLFLHGEVVEKDVERALRYFQGSVARDDIYGMNNLAVMYLDGIGVPQDYSRAMELFTKADEGGHPSAANNLGRMYLSGWGVPTDPRRAAELYERATQRGEPHGANNRAWLALNGADGAPDPVLAARFYALSASIDRGPASAEGREALARLAPAEKNAAARQLARELQIRIGPAKGGARAESAQIVAAVKRAKIGGRVETLDEALIGLARARWVRDRPRFDLF